MPSDLHEWKITFEDYYDNPIGMAHLFSKLKTFERFNMLGKWSWRTEEVDEMWELLAAGAYKVNILRDSDIWMSGFIHTVLGEDTGDDSWIEIRGADQLFYLASRVVYPSTDGDFTADDYDDRTGRAETIVKGYVDDHASNVAVLPARRWPALTTQVDFAGGDIVTAEGRFQNLLEFCAGIFASGGGQGMRVVDDEFQVYTPNDLSGSVVLAGGLLNIALREYRFDYPAANYIIAGGAGDLVARTFYYASDAASILTYGRIEQFVDTKNDSGQESADKHLEQGEDQYSIVVVPNMDDPEFKPYDDYWVGDTITSQVFGSSYSNVVRSGSVTVDVEAATEQYQVSLETLLAKDQNPFRTIKQMEAANSSRISSQERN